MARQPTGAWGERLRRCILVPILAVAGAMPTFAADREYGPPQFLGADVTLPAGVAYDPARERLFVLSVGSARVHYAALSVALDGGPWSALGERADPADAAALAQPQGIAVDGSGNVYVADTFNNQARLYRYDPATDAYTLDASFASETRTAVDGIAIDRPRDIAVAGDGAIYLLDSGNRRILRADGPAARRWTVHHRGTDWSHARGLAAAPSGDLYVADTDNHRIVRVRPDGAEESFGRFGRDRGALRYPNDVAVGEDGRIYVADTHNHRIAIFDGAYRYYRSLGQAPLIRNPESLALGPDRKLFVADIERADVVAYLGPSAAPQFDGYLRNVDGDTGEEPSTAADPLRSPDILIRLRPDVDVERATAEGLDAFGSEAVLPGGEYFLYFAVNNSGPRPLPPGALRVYTAQPDTTEPLYQFPEEWRTDETFALLRGAVTAQPESLLRLPEIAPPGTGSPGRTVLGPLSWRPQATTSACDTSLFVMARHLNVHDPIAVESDNGLEQAAASNDVAVRRVPFVAAGCIPRADRYESNDTLGTAASVVEPWQHLHARCPRSVTRALGVPYPDTLCEGIFEDGPAPRAAEEIWTREIGNLSLHGERDADFYRIDLPALDDPAYGDADINPARIRDSLGSRPGYTPTVMPECGAVQRTDIGPAGADRTVWVNVSTELVLEVAPEGPPESEVAPRPVQTVGEQLHVYVGAEGAATRDTALFAGTSLRKRIGCPRDVHGLEDILVSFGERESSDGSPSPRDLLQTGGYKLSVRYVSSIERGIPAWAEDPGITGRLDCYGVRPFAGSGGRFAFGIDVGSLPGSFGSPLFPLCGIPGFDRAGFFERHPRLPTPGCIADGPGCFSTYLFHWPSGRARFDMAFAAGRELRISLIDAQGKAIAETQLSPNAPPASMGEFKGVDLSSLELKSGASLYGGFIRVDQLPADYYGLRIEGPPADFAISFAPVLEDKGL